MVVACCWGADTGRSKLPPFCSHSPKAAQKQSSQLSGLGVSREERDYPCVTKTRLSSWSRTMGLLLPHFFFIQSHGCGRSPRSHHARCPSVLRGIRYHVRYQQGDPESDQLHEKWDQSRTQEPWDSGLRAMASKLQTSCHPDSSLGYQKS